MGTSILKTVIEMPLMISDYVDRWARRATFKNGGGYMGQYGDSFFGGAGNSYRGAPATYDAEKHRKQNNQRDRESMQNNDGNTLDKKGNNTESTKSSDIRSALEKGAKARQNANNTLSSHYGRDTQDLADGNNIREALEHHSPSPSPDRYRDTVISMGAGNSQIDGAQFAQNASEIGDVDEEGNTILNNREHLTQQEDGTFAEKNINGAIVNDQALDKARDLGLTDEEWTHVTDLNDVDEEVRPQEFANRLLNQTEDGFEIALRNLDATPEDYKALEEHDLVKNVAKEGEEPNWVIDSEAMSKAYHDPEYDLTSEEGLAKYQEYCDYADTSRLLEKYGGDLSQLNAEDLKTQQNNKILEDTANGVLMPEDIEKQMKDFNDKGVGRQYRRAELVQALATNGAEAFYHNMQDEIAYDQSAELKKQQDLLAQKHYDEALEKATAEERQRIINRRRKMVDFASKTCQMANKYAFHPVWDATKRSTVSLVRNTLSGGHNDRTILGNRLTGKMDHYIQHGSSGQHNAVSQWARQNTKKVAKEVGRTTVHAFVEGANTVTRGALNLRNNAQNIAMATAGINAGNATKAEPSTFTWQDYLSTEQTTQRHVKEIMDRNPYLPSDVNESREMLKDDPRFNTLTRRSPLKKRKNIVEMQSKKLN